MGCLLALLALITPRVVIIMLWLFTHWFRVLNSRSYAGGGGTGTC